MNKKQRQTLAASRANYRKGCGKISQKIFTGSRSDIMMEYKGYFGKVEFDDEADIFYGEVINLRDIVTFQGETVTELRNAFRDSIDDYLDFCASRGEEPEKPYSGKFVVRVDPELHKTIFIEAKKTGKSINAWVSDNLSKILQENRQPSH